MRKYFKLLIILILMLSVTGCVKFNYSISINKDKSMDLEIILASDKRFSDAENTINFTDIDSDELNKNGYLVFAYNEDMYEGSRIIKSFKNIDDISTTKDNWLVHDLRNALSGTDNTLFYVKKGFLKNTYIGRFKMTGTDEMEEQFDSNTNINVNDDNQSVIDQEDVQELEDAMSEMSKEMDFKFIIKVPYKTLSNNATSVSKDQKTLTWNLFEIKDENANFEFYLYNFNNIIICLIILLIIVVVLIIIIKKITKNRKKNKRIDNIDTNNTLDTNNVITTQEFVEQINPDNPSLTFINNNQDVLIEEENKFLFIKDIDYDDEVSDEPDLNNNDSMDINSQINSIQNILNINSNQDDNKNN